MKLSRKMIVSLAGVVVLAAAIAVSFVVVVGDGKAGLSAQPAQAAAVETVAAPAAESEAVQAEVVMSADFAAGYHSVDQLTESADLVVRGEVVDVSYVDFRTCAYTKVTLRVDTCFKGGAANGDKITIMEVGGITSMATINGDKFGQPTKEDADTKVKVLLNGAPLTKVGDECVYFLGTGEIGVVSGAYYVPMGAYQGRFSVDGGVAKRFVPADMQGGKYTSLAMDEASIDDTVTEAAAR